MVVYCTLDNVFNQKEIVLFLIHNIHYCDKYRTLVIGVRVLLLLFKIISGSGLCKGLLFIYVSV